MMPSAARRFLLGQAAVEDASSYIHTLPFHSIHLATSPYLPPAAMMALSA